MIKNKGMFFSGLGLFILQLFVGLFLLVKDMTVSEGTANAITMITFIVCFNLASFGLMIWGALYE